MKERALLIEDDIDAATDIVIMLQQQGYKVEIATNGIEALKLINNNPGQRFREFDLILIDENLPNFTINTGPTGPRRAKPDAILFEGSDILSLLTSVQINPPKTIIAISRVKRNNRRLMEIGATHSVTDKDPKQIKEIIEYISPSWRNPVKKKEI